MSWQDYEYGPVDDYFSADQLADLGVIWPDDISAAMRDVIDERERQQCAEGWTPEHDDTHINGELAAAAQAYIAYSRNSTAASAEAYRMASPPSYWPWPADSFKPKDLRKDLLRACALIVAEIERLDRASKQAPGNTP